MSVHVLFFATLADITGMKQAELDVRHYSTVGAIFEAFARDFPELEGHRRSALSAVNSDFSPFDTPVKDGDEVAFFPPMSGG